MEPAEYKRLRKKIGTQQDVADALGVSKPTITRREAGKADINAEAELAIKALADQQPPALADCVHELAGITQRLAKLHGADALRARVLKLRERMRRGDMACG